MKLVCISNNPLPYHTPILNQLGSLVDLHVIYMSREHPMESFIDDWGVEPRYEHSFMWSHGFGSHRSDFRGQLSLGVSTRLMKLSPDVILFSSWGPLVWEPLLWKTMARRKAVMWAESTQYSGLIRSGLSNKLRSLVLSSTDGFISNGTMASDYLEILGVSPAKIVTSCLPSIPLSSVTCQSPRVFDATSPRLLFVGRFIPRKRPLELLHVFQELKMEFSMPSLTMIGDGPLMPQVAEVASTIGESVRLLGRLEGSDLEVEYQKADILVVPSRREVWGLVVNEALAHGLYVIATDEVGSAHDLLGDGSGTVVPVDDLSAILPAIRLAVGRLASDTSLSQIRSGKVATCTTEKFAHDVVRAIEISTKGSNNE